MSLFHIKKQKLEKLKLKSLDLEKNLQTFFEKNLKTILNINFLASEYSTSFGGRIDSLGIDKDNSPIIIEYKKWQNDNVINQGLSYLRWLLDHKAEFELLCQKKWIQAKINWDSPRVICIAERYSKFDIDTVEVLPIKIELYEYKLYENNLLQLDRVQAEKIKISTKNIHKSSINKEEKIQKEYFLEDHLKNKPENIKKLFEKIREKILSFDANISEEPQKFYIAYKNPSNFVDIFLWKSFVKLWLNLPTWTIKIQKSFLRDLVNPKKIGHHWNWDYEIKIENENYLEEISNLIEFSYTFNK